MTDDRSYWLNNMLAIAEPLITELERETLKENMPVEQIPGSNREAFSHLEGFARLLNGMAPWLERQAEDPAEEKLRLTYIARIQKCLEHATDPASKDYMNFGESGQPLVDSAFLAQAIHRAPEVLWKQLDANIQKNILQALKATRNTKPVFSNWLLFSAIIEAVLYELGEVDWDAMRIDYAIKQFEQWYVGDGMYSDGASFHFDYYNSYVIHPMLLDIVDIVGKHDQGWSDSKKKIKERALQYTRILERMISPEGTFPVIGRSIAYRFGAFHHLANQVLREELPEELAFGQLRAGLTAVLRTTFRNSDLFDEKGWLQIGLAGHQPELGEFYISTGSLYLCSFLFLPLGLSQSHPFWQEEADMWTNKKAWSSQRVAIYHSLD
ncbi:DUF2264 domain-containing protein [Gracilibacillus dipsosauri]|uniref:DUF2264 domain-containing protein n=1 Tax=Gracilibacillus dipsosauri TaxID=178340 RepID=UPI002409D747